MTDIHPTAIVDENAKIGKNVSIGPYSAIGPEVELGDGIELISHVVVSGRTTIGANTRVFPFASIGHQPQDQKYNGEASSLEIGCRCLGIRVAGGLFRRAGISSAADRPARWALLALEGVPRTGATSTCDTLGRRSRRCCVAAPLACRLPSERLWQSLDAGAD
ncbi:MAG: hypothetical protein IH994_07120, partial [Proteobacteria bacterium]|nr:hypothetical protein [Pseudomonadota bacterium]